MAPDCMNWPGWHWVAIILAAVQGVWMGWTARSIHQRTIDLRAWVAEREAERQKQTVENVRGNLDGN